MESKIRNQVRPLGVGVLLLLSGIIGPAPWTGGAQGAVLTVRPTDLAPPKAYQGQPFIPVLRLDLSVDMEWVRVDWIQIDKTGNMPDEDIAAVQLWFDADNDFTFDPTRDVLLNTRVNLWPDRLLRDADGRWDPRREYHRPIPAPNSYTSLAYVGEPPLQVESEGRLFRAMPGNFLGLAANGDDVVNGVDSDGTPINIPGAIRSRIRRGSVILDGFNTDYDNSFDPFQDWEDGNGTDAGMDEMPLPVLSDDALFQRRFYYDPNLIIDEALGDVDGHADTTYVNRNLIIESGKERSFFIVYALAENATLGTHVGARLADPSYIHLDTPRDPNRPFRDVVSSDNFPMESGQISPIGSEVRVEGGTLAVSDVVGGRVEQGMARITLSINHGQARLEALTIHDEGTDPSTDVSAVKLFLDNPFAQNGQFDPIGAATKRDVYLQAFSGTVDRNTFPAPPGSPVFTDPSQNWVPGALVGYTLTLRNGPEARTRYQVISNTTTSLTVDRPISIDPNYKDTRGNLIPVEYTVAFERGFTGDGDGDDRATTFSGLNLLLEAGRPVTLLVVYDITGDPTAAGHFLRTRVSEGDVTLTTPREDAVILPAGGIDSGNIFVWPRILRVTATDVAPATVVQGQVQNPMLQVRLAADEDAAAGPSILTALTVHKTGTSTDANGTLDVSRLRLYHDLNGNGLVEGSDQELTDPSQTFVYPLGSTTQTLPLATPLTIAPGAIHYLLITYDFNPLANTNVAIGVGLADLQMVPPDAASDLIFDAGTPTVLPASNQPVSSKQAVIVEQLLVTSQSLAPRAVARGDRAVLMEKLTLDVSPNPAGNSAVTLQSLTVNKIGSNTRSEDVPFVRLFREVDDKNRNGRVEAGEGREIAFGSVVDGQVSLANLNLTVKQGAPLDLWLALDISNTASTETTVGLRIPRPDQMPVVAPDVVAEAAFPITTAVSTIGNTLQVQGHSLAPANAAPGQQGVVVQSLTFTTVTKEIALLGLRVSLEMRDRFGLLDPANPPRPQDIVAVLGAFRDVSRNGRVDPEDDSLGLADFGGLDFERDGAVYTTAVNLKLAGKAGTDFIVNVDRTETVLLVVNLAAGVARGVDVLIRLAGIDPTDPYTLHDAAEAPSGLPNAVQVRFPNNVSGEFPLASRPFRVGDGLRVSGESLSPAQVYRTQVGAPFLKLVLTAQPGDIVLQRLSLERVGSAPDDAISSLRLYYDGNGNGSYQPAEDTQQLGNEQTFTGGLATFDLTSFPEADRLIPGGGSRILFVVGDIAEGAPSGETVGLQLARAEDVTLNPQAAVIEEGFPITSIAVPIGDGLKVERQPLLQDPPVGNRVGQGRENLALLRLRLTALTGAVTLTEMQVDKVGGRDSDVAGIRLFEDTNGNGIFSVSQADPSQNDTPVSPSLRFGEQGFPGRVLFSNINIPITSGRPKDLFVVVDVDPNASQGHPLLVEIRTAQALRLLAPDVVMDLPDRTGDGLPDALESGQTGILTAPPTADYRTLTDNQATYSPDQWKNAAIVVRRNLTVQGEALVTTNTAQTLRVDPPLTQARQGDEYLLGPSVDINRLTISAVSLVAATVPSRKVEQGQDTIPMMQLKLETNAGAILLRSLKVRLTGSGAVANDVSRVRLLEDVNGNGRIDGGIDLDIAQPQRFSTEGFAVFTSLNKTVQAGRPIYLLVIYDISAAANAGHQLQVALGDGNPDHVADFVGVAGDDKVELATDPLESEALTVTGNTLNVQAENLAPDHAAVGAEQVPLLLLRFSTPYGSVLIRGLQVTGTSPTEGAPARLVRRVRVFDDVNRDGVIGSGDPEVARTTEFPFAGRSEAELLFQPYTVVAGTTRQAVVAYDLAGDVARPNTADRVGAKIEAADLSVEDPPDRISPDFQGFQSGEVMIGRMLVIQAAEPDPAPTVASRGQRVSVGTLILTPRLRVDGSDLTLTDPIVLRELRLSLTGTAQDSDFTAVRLIRQELGGEVEIGQSSFTAGRATFTFSSHNEIREATRVRVDVEVAPTATAGRTFALAMTAGDAVGVDAPDFAALAGLLEFPSNPISLQGGLLIAQLQSTPSAPARAPQGGGGLVMAKIRLRVPQGEVPLRDLRIDRVGLGSTDADVAAVKLYRDWTDANGDGRIAPTEATLLGSGVFSSGAMTIRGLSLTVSKERPVDLYLAIDISEAAALGAELGLRIADETYLRVDPPNAVATHDPETLAALFPIQSGLARVTGNFLTVRPIAGPAELQTPSAVQQGRLGVRLLGLQLQVDSGTAVVNRVRVQQSGSASAGAAIAAFRLFEWRSVDNRFQADQDVLVQLGVASFGALPNPQEAEILNLNVEVTPDRPVKLVLAYDLKPQAPAGQTIGVSLPNNGYVGIRSPDTVEPFADATGDGRPDPLPTPPQTVAIEAAPGTLNVEGFNVVPGSDPAAGLSGSVVQGQRNVPFLLLRLQATSRELHLVAIDLTEVGTVLASTGVVQVKLFEWAGTALPTPEDLANRPLLAAAVFSPTSETTRLSGFKLAIPPDAPSPKQLVIAADIGPNPTPGQTVGFTLPGPSALLLEETEAKVNDFPDGPIQSALPVIRRSAFTLEVAGQSLAPANVTPGQARVAFLRLDFSTAAGSVTMNGLVVQKAGSLSDAQVAAWRLFLDGNGNGLFEAGSDSQLSGSTQFDNGLARFRNFQLTVAQGQPRSVFVVADLASNARLGDTVGLRVPFEDPQDPTQPAVRVVAPDLVAAANFPLASGLATVRNAVLVSGFDVAPAEAAQGISRLAMLRLSFGAVAGTGNIYGLRLRSGGTATANDVVSMRLYADSNGSRQFEPGVDQPYGQTVAVTGGVARFVFDPPLVVDPNRPLSYFVVVQLAAEATAGRTVSVRLESGDDVAVNDPNGPVSSFATGSFPLTSGLSRIVGSLLVVTGANLIPAAVTAGQTDVPFLAVVLEPEAGTVVLRTLRARRIGGTDDADVVRLRLCRDENNDGQFDPAIDLPLPLSSQQGLSGGRVAFSDLHLLCQEGQPVRLFLAGDINPQAPIGRVIGFSIDQSSDLQVEPPDGVANQNFPIRSGFTTVGGGLVVDGQSLAPDTAAPGTRNIPVELLTFAATEGSVVLTGLNFEVNGSLDPSQIARVRLFRDDNRNSRYDEGIDLQVGEIGRISGRRVAFTGLNETVTAAGGSLPLLVLLDLSNQAALGRTVGLSLPDAEAVVVSGVNVVSHAHFPIASDLILITTGQVTVSGTSLAPQVIRPAQENVPLLRLQFVTGGGGAVLKGLTLERLGEGGDADVAAVRLHIDSDRNGQFNHGVDAIVAAGTFKNGLAAFLQLNEELPPDAEGRSFFVVIDVAAGMPIGHSVGVFLPRFTAVQVAEPMEVAAANFPIASDLSSVSETVRWTAPAGISLISVPTDPLRRAATEVFGVSAANLKMARWDPAAQSYRTNLADPVVGEIHLGRAYWVQLPFAVTRDINGLPAPSGEPYAITVLPGWNMVGHPRSAAVLWDQVQVRDGSITVGLREAHQRGWISAFAWTYQAGQPYLLVHPTAPQAQRLLEPGQGYWVLVRTDHPVELLIPPAAASPLPSAAPSREKPTLEKWQVQLVARSGTEAAEGPADVSYIGLGPETMQAPQPPMAPGATVDLYVLAGPEDHPSRLAVDLRSNAARRQTWTLAVATAQAGQEVILSWPDLNVSLPAGQRMTLLDRNSGEKRSLRTTASYRFRSTDQPRLLELIYEPAEPSRGLVISNVTVQASRAAGPARLGFHLSDEAVTTVEVTSLAGRLVRRLEEQTARTAGQQRVSWDYTDIRGVPVPPGPYLVRITAFDAEGHPTQVVRVLTVGP